MENEKKKAVELSRKLSEKINEVLIVKDDLRKVKREAKLLNNKLEKLNKEKENIEKENEEIRKQKPFK